MLTQGFPDVQLDPPARGWTMPGEDSGLSTIAPPLGFQITQLAGQQQADRPPAEISVHLPLLRQQQMIYNISTCLWPVSVIYNSPESCSQPYLSMFHFPWWQVKDILTQWIVILNATPAQIWNLFQVCNNFFSSKNNSKNTNAHTCTYIFKNWLSSCRSRILENTNEIYKILTCTERNLKYKVYFHLS